MTPTTATAPDYTLLAAYWLAGCIGGMAIRFGWWGRKKDPDVATFAMWMHTRKFANVIAISVCVLFTLLWAEGQLFTALHLDRLDLKLSYGLSPIVGAAFTIFSHYILATGKRKAEALSGPVDDDV